MIRCIRKLRIGMVLFLLVATPGVVAAQAVTGLTGSVTGTVKDPSGGVVPGVTVVIASPSQMGTREAVTSAEGMYRFGIIPTGDYSVTFSLAGFATIRVADVRVTPGFTASVDARLQPVGVEERVTVTGQAPIVDRTATTVRTSFDEATMKNLPNAGDIRAVLLQTPAVRVSGVDVGGTNIGSSPAIFAYGNTSQARILVEGLDTSEGSGGNSNNFGVYPEVQVAASANGADVPMPGLQVQMISKSGSNQYHGGVSGGYETEKWQSFNIDADQIARGVTGGGGLTPRDVNRLSAYHDVSADIGGYVKKDRFWWHGSVRDQRVATRVTNYPGQLSETSLWFVDAKATYNLSQNQRLIAYGAWNRKLVPALIAAGFIVTNPIIQTQADASYQDFRSPTYKVEWNGILGGSTFVEVRTGSWNYVLPFLKQPDLSPGPRFEDLILGTASGKSIDRSHTRWRHQTMGSLSRVAGPHTLKLGLEYLKDGSEWNVNAGSFGDVVQILQNSVPTEVYLQETPVKALSELDTYSAYLTDNWRLGDRLSINLGVRYDRYHAFLPEQTHPASRFAGPTLFPAVDNLFTWNKVAPRLGLTWALDSSQHTIVKGSYGVYYWLPATDIGRDVNPNSAAWWKRYTWTDSNVNGSWDPGEQGRLLGSSGGSGSGVLDSNLRDTYSVEATGWIERELNGTMAVRTGVVWRGERQAIRTVNQNQPYEAFSIPVTVADPGPDGVAGNVDDGAAIQGFNLSAAYLGLPTVNLFTNLPNTDADHVTWEATLQRRLHKRWSLMLAGSHTWSSAQAIPNSNRPVPAAYTPNRAINAGPNGELHFTLWTAKLNATWEAPGGILLTPMVTHESGLNYARTLQARFNYGTTAILAEPVDSRRTPNVTVIDTRVEKRLKLRSNATIGLFLDGLNLFNANPSQQVIAASGASFLRPQQILPPRLLRIGARFDW